MSVEIAIGAKKRSDRIGCLKRRLQYLDAELCRCEEAEKRYSYIKQERSALSWAIAVVENSA